MKFSAADTARVAEKLSTGFTKSIKFISTDWIKEPTTLAAGSSQHQFQFSTSVVHPLRTWVVSSPFNTYGTAFANQSAIRDFKTDPTYAPGVMPIHWTQTNILINSIPYFRQNQMNYQDQWEQLREQFDPDNGSMISYVDFLNYKSVSESLISSYA